MTGGTRCRKNFRRLNFTLIQNRPGALGTRLAIQQASSDFISICKFASEAPSRQSPITNKGIKGSSLIAITFRSRSPRGGLPTYPPHDEKLFFRKLGMSEKSDKWSTRKGTCGAALRATGSRP